MTGAREDELLAEYRASAARRAERVTELLRDLDTERARADVAERRRRDAEAKVAQLERRLSRARAASAPARPGPVGRSFPDRVRASARRIRRSVSSR